MNEGVFWGQDQSDNPSEGYYMNCILNVSGLNGLTRPSLENFPVENDSTIFIRRHG